MKRIAIFQSDLGVGGIQKSIINLLSGIDTQRVSVDLFLSQRDEFWNTKLPDAIGIHYLTPIPKLCSFIPFDLAKKFVRYDFESFGEYDLAIDFNSYQCSCAVGALTVPAKKRVMWIHNNVEIKLQNEWKYRVLWHNFKGKFKYYDGFVPVSAALTEPFERCSGISGKPFTVIQNVINVEEINEKMRCEPENVSVDAQCMNFTALGRLCHQKGYDLMLDIFAKACEVRQDIRLYIIGDGPDRGALAEQCAKLEISDRVTFLGNRENPYCCMKLMDAFISTSRYEGQPLNIMEAMAVGLPLYCSKNLESYTEGLHGYDDMVSALVNSRKEEKHPDDLRLYNGRILDAVYKLCGEDGCENEK